MGFEASVAQLVCVKLQLSHFIDRYIDISVCMFRYVYILLICEILLPQFLITLRQFSAYTTREDLVRGAHDRGKKADSITKQITHRFVIYLAPHLCRYVDTSLNLIVQIIQYLLYSFLYFATSVDHICYTLWPICRYESVILQEKEKSH